MKKFLAFIFSVIFIILLPITLVAYNIKTNVFNSDFYKKELARYNTYEVVINEAIGQLFSSEERVGTIQEIPLLTFDELKDLIKELITPVWLQQQIENIINQSFAWFESNTDIRNAKIAVSLVNLKNKSPDIIKNKFEQKVKDLKTCTEADLKIFNEHDFKTIPCVPADYDINDFLKDFDINGIINQVPDELDLIKLIKGEVAFGDEPAKEAKNNEEVENTFNTINRARDLIKTAFTIINYLFIVLGLTFLLIAGLTMNKLRSMFRWLGFNLFLPGLFLFIGTIILSNLLINRVGVLFTDSKLSTEISQVLKNIVVDLISQILTNLKIESIILLIVGIVLITFSYIIKSGKSAALSSVKK